MWNLFDANFSLAFSALSDLVLAVYPAFIIWNLNMVPRVKLIITFVMMLGILLVHRLPIKAAMGLPNFKSVSAYHLILEPWPLP